MAGKGQGQGDLSTGCPQPLGPFGFPTQGTQGPVTPGGAAARPHKFTALRAAPGARVRPLRRRLLPDGAPGLPPGRLHQLRPLRPPVRRWVARWSRGVPEAAPHPAHGPFPLQLPGRPTSSCARIPTASPETRWPWGCWRGPPPAPPWAPSCGCRAGFSGPQAGPRPLFAPQPGLTHPWLGTCPEPPSASPKHPGDRDPHTRPPPSPSFCIK